jgi:cytochrome oxidase assembly protein ShyY1
MTIVAVAAVVAIACVALGLWQLRRLEDRRARNAAIERARQSEPIDLTDAGESETPPVFTPVRLSGRFDPQREVLLYGRSLGGRSGHHVVTPLILERGTAVLVVRGWVPFAFQRAPVERARPPSGDLTIGGFVVPDEGDGSTAPDANGVIGRLDVEGIAATLPYPVSAFAVQLTDQTEPQPGELPIRIGSPELSDGPHLSYAIQWFSFAAITVVGAAVLLRRERRGATTAS